jgi:hypothetical protein
VQFSTTFSSLGLTRNNCERNELKPRKKELFKVTDCENTKVGGLDLSRRDLDRDLDLDAQKVSVSTVEKISTVFKS